MSVVTSIWRSRSVEIVIDILKIYGAYVIIINLIDSMEWHFGVLKTIVIACIPLSVVQIYVFLRIGANHMSGLGGYGLNFAEIGSASGDAEGVGGYTNGFLSNASDFGVGMLVVLPIAVLLYRHEKRKWLKMIYLGSFVSFTASVICSGSRGAFLGLVTIGIFYLFVSKKKAMYVAIALLALILALIFAPKKYYERIRSIENYEQDESANIRLELWKSGWKIYLDHPVFGVGVGNFSTAYGKYYHPDTTGGVLWWNPHNIFIQILSETGTFGICAFIWLIVSTFRLNLRTKKRCCPDIKRQLIHDVMNAYNCSLIGYVVSGQFITVTYYPHLYMLAALSSSFSTIIQRQDDLATVSGKNSIHV